MAREQARAKLLPQTTGVLTEINNIFREARILLKSTTPKEGGQPYSDFILILDNLEKIQRLAGAESGEASRKALFIESAPLFTGMDAHIVYIVPLSLVRAADQAL